MFPPLYAILDPSQSSLPVLQLAQTLADAGVELMQLRHKRATPAELLDEAKSLSKFLGSRRVRFILNDRADLAAMASAGGVHVGQDDLPVEDARCFCSPPLWVGVSTHNLNQFERAILTSADYIAVGPIFSTATKLNPGPRVGVEFIRSVRLLTKRPIVAIGGITIDHAAEVFDAGADSVAVVKDLIGATDPAERAKQYLAVAARRQDSRP